MKVLTERRAGVQTITLNDPQTYNALTQELLDQFLAVLDQALTATDVHAIVLTGAGRGFCAGANLASDTFEAGAGVADFLRSTINRAVLAMRTSRKPIIVAVNGPAAGAGVGLALAGDIVLAATEARFVLSFVRVGAALDAGASKFVQNAIGQSRARALALLGQPLDAQKAEDWGLIWKCVEPDQLMAEATTIATGLATGPRVAIGLIKEELQKAEDLDLSTALELEAGCQGRAFETDDLKEGAAAFVAKRKANFLGR